MVRKFLKFGSIGILMSGFGLTVNTILLKFFGTDLIITYVSVYIFNVFIAYLLNSKFTFQSKLTIDRMVKYYFTYLVGLLLGVVLLKIFKGLFDFENWVFPFMVVPFTMTNNFLLSNYFLPKDR